MFRSRRIHRPILTIEGPAAPPAHDVSATNRYKAALSDMMRLIFDLGVRLRGTRRSSTSLPTCSTDSRSSAWSGPPMPAA